jgi:hypothetical protein
LSVLPRRINSIISYYIIYNNMKRSSKDGTFGAPKPLAGQAGYK